MKKLSEVKMSKKETKVNCERAELLETILVLINQERVGTSYKPLTAKALAVKVSYLSVPDLYWFHRKCSLRKGSYGKCFFGELKVRPPSKPY